VRTTKKVSAPPKRLSDQALLSLARAVFDTESEGVTAVRNGLGKPFVALVRLCLRTLDAGGKLVLTGVGKSGHIGHKLAATLASTGSPAVFMHPVEAMHGDLGLLGAHDLLLALSYSGETDELIAVLPAAKRLGVPIAALTGVTDSRLAKWSDLIVPMSVPREACPFNLAPTSTTTALLVLGDALAITLLQARGFGKHDYARLHPAGAIGRGLTLRVTDLMRTGLRFPTVREKTPIREALVAMTQARTGSVAITDRRGRLLGIFTDGDFRRHATDVADLLHRPIGEFMTPKPITITADAMAIEVMKILETRKIDDLIVTDADGHALGLIDIQDLPRFKVM
jgi:arabinose-5-phosphate isomerase